MDRRQQWRLLLLTMHTIHDLSNEVYHDQRMSLTQLLYYYLQLATYISIEEKQAINLKYFLWSTLKPLYLLTFSYKVKFNMSRLSKISVTL